MKKTVCCLLSLVMAVSIISGCSRAGSGAKVTGSADALSDSSFSTALKQKEGYTKVAANERLELYVNKAEKNGVLRQEAVRVTAACVLRYS